MEEDLIEFLRRRGTAEYIIMEFQNEKVPIYTFTFFFINSSVNKSII